MTENEIRKLVAASGGEFLDLDDDILKISDPSGAHVTCLRISNLSNQELTAIVRKFVVNTRSIRKSSQVAGNRNSLDDVPRKITDIRDIFHST